MDRTGSCVCGGGRLSDRAGISLYSSILLSPYICLPTQLRLEGKFCFFLLAKQVAGGGPALPPFCLSSKLMKLFFSEEHLVESFESKQLPVCWDFAGFWSVNIRFSVDLCFSIVILHCCLLLAALNKSEKVGYTFSSDYIIKMKEGRLSAASPPARWSH